MRARTTRQVFGQALLVGIASAAGGAIGRGLSGHAWFGWLAWLAVVLDFVAALIVGVGFRRGDARYIDWLDQDGPDSIRLMPILGIPSAILFLPLVFVVGALLAWPPVWPHWAVGTVAFGLAGWGLAGFGILTLLAYKPPWWLIPPWVLAQDPYAPIELRTYRRSLLLAGILSLVLGGLAFVVAAWIWVVQF